jgi:predicted acetyltransferase
MPVTDVDIRPLGPGDDMAAQADLSERAFGHMTERERERFARENGRRIRDGAYLGAFADGRPAGAASYHDMRQWWHGRPVPMAGVAGVKIAPEYRGRGIGSRLMTALLRQIAARGYPLSALYPATMPIYRSLGWELAGSCSRLTVPARGLRALLAPDTGPDTGPEADPGPAADAAGIRRAVPGDAGAVLAIAGRAHEAARDNGPVTRDFETVAGWLASDGLYAYLARDGFIAYRWSDGSQDLAVERCCASSALAARALWSLVASHSSTAGTVTARLAPHDALWWLTRERDVAVARRSMWMLRVVDAPAAIAARGFPAAVSLSVALRVEDRALPANAGSWQLTIAGGKGSLTPAGAPGERDGGPLVLGARGLAALYGGTPLATLRVAGLAAGGNAAADAALDAAFGGPAFMTDEF